MSDAAGSGASLQGAEIAALSAALAAVDMRMALLRVVDGIAAARMQVVVFSAAICFHDATELERIYSSRADVYPIAVRKSKRETSWAQQVMRERRVFVGEGPLEMAAAFDDQERMASLGIRSIINVPVVVGDRCLGVLNFGRAVERVAPADVQIGRLLGLVSVAAFL
jgi:hypothetical protein